MGKDTRQNLSLSMDNHYETLGIRSSATAQEVRRAYRILARRYHPDLNPGKASEEKFKAVDFMRRVRDELGILYLADKNKYLSELRKAMDDFKKQEKAHSH